MLHANYSPRPPKFIDLALSHDANTREH